MALLLSEKWTEELEKKYIDFINGSYQNRTVTLPGPTSWCGTCSKTSRLVKGSRYDLDEEEKINFDNMCKAAEKNGYKVIYQDSKQEYFVIEKIELP